jgi:hypothetical protein
VVPVAPVPDWLLPTAPVLPVLPCVCPVALPDTPPVVLDGDVEVPWGWLEELPVVCEVELLLLSGVLLWLLPLLLPV